MKSVMGRFELEQSDGKHCYQVLVYDNDDLVHWCKECIRTNHLIAYDCHIPENFNGKENKACDRYQIFPHEMRERFAEIGFMPIPQSCVISVVESEASNDLQ